MFQAINPDFLLGRRLRGLESTAHAGRECCVVSLRAANNEADVLVEVAPLRSDGKSVALEECAELTLRVAAQRYAVDGKEGAKTLAAFLENGCSDLLSHWPGRRRGQSSECGAVLAALLSPTHTTALPEHLLRWRDHACRFLRLHACLAEAAPGQTAAEFFGQLERQLKEDRRRWQEETSAVGTPKLSEPRSLNPAPKPRSLLTELHWAGTEAEKERASDDTARPRLRSYLEVALEHVWMKICGETALLKDRFGETVSVLRVEAKIVTADNEKGNPNRAEVEVEFEADRFELRIGVPFDGPSEDGRQAEPLFAWLFIREKAHTAPEKGCGPVYESAGSAVERHEMVARSVLPELGTFTIARNAFRSGGFSARGGRPLRAARDLPAKERRPLPSGSKSTSQPRREKAEVRHPARRSAAAATEPDAGVAPATISVYHPKREVQKITLPATSVGGDGVELLLSIDPPDAQLEIEGDPVPLDEEGNVTIGGPSGHTMDVCIRRPGRRDFHRRIKLSNSQQLIRLKPSD